jgi:hypothetical protein
MKNSKTTPNSLLSDWLQFEENYLISGVPHRVVVRATPVVELFVDLGANRFGARFESLEFVPDQLKIMLHQIKLNNVLVDGRRYVEIVSENRSLYASFYSLLGEIVSDTVNRTVSPVTAISDAVERWQNLLLRNSMLSDEYQTGLFGEIWFLRKLIDTVGVRGLDAWIGPKKEAHDFRLGHTEFEVKTTSKADRIHRINGASQLSPSAGCSLYLVSVQVADAGSGGASLPDAVADVLSRLEKWDGASERFLRLLECAGYNFDDRPLYTGRRRLRTDPVLIKIADGIPRLTLDAIQNLGEQYCPQLISHVTYDINVSNFGHADGSKEFLEIIQAN